MLKKKENRILLLKGTVAFIFPFILCLLFCAIKKTSLFHIYLPSSLNNDSLFYYKVVEAIAKYGIPRGYFGYNESHALIGTLAA